MAPRRRCQTCGSRQWHKEPSSGLIACSEGHVLQNYRTETNEVENAGPHAMSKRKLKTTGMKGEKKIGSNPKLYHGARGRYHYLLCQQLILRMQVETITNLWNLPPEFETICRDVWSLHLSLLPDPPSPEPYSYAEELEIKETSSIRRENVLVPKKACLPTITEELVALPSSGQQSPNRLGDQQMKSIVDGGGSEESESEDDSEIEELLRQNSEISSSSEEDSNEAPPTRARINQHGRSETVLILESPASTLAVLVLALWMLRIPMLYSDLARLVEKYEVPYLDPVRLLPSSMVVHLTKHSISELSPPHVPGTLAIHRLVARLAKRLNADYGVFTPECNTGPLLWRLTRSIGGTPTLYALTKRLGRILSLPLTLHSTLAPSLERVKVKDSEQHKYDNVPPEVALIASILIVLKMCFGLDGEPRFPRDAGDPVLSLPRVQEWLAYVQELDDIDASSKDTEFNSENGLAVGDLSDDDVDEYMAFCQHALLGHDNEDAVTRTFPLLARSMMDGPGVNHSRKILPAGVLLEEEAQKLRPAEGYTIWNSRDVFGSVAGEYSTVVGRACGVVRTGEDYVCSVVEMYERRIVRWWEDRRRQCT